MWTDLPPVAGPRDRRTRDLRNGVRRIGLLCGGIEAADQHIDLRHIEAGYRDIEVEIELDQVLQLDGQDLRIPARFLGQSIVGKDVGTFFSFAEMFEPNDWHGLKTKKLGSLDATVAGDDDVVLVDQDRIVKAEGTDAGRNLCDLLRAVGAFRA